MYMLVKDIMYGVRKDIVSAPIRAVLYVLSLLNDAIMRLRNKLYDARILPVCKMPCTVISVGNIIIGGTGKTPVVMMTAQLLKDAGKHVAVVSRGYKREGGPEPLIVSDGATLLVSPSEAGDEPHLIASILEDIPVVVGADRCSAARLAVERFSPDVIVLDDAFQHRSIHRDTDIVTVEADNPAGSGYLLPRGLLRESLRAFERVKVIVATGYRDSHNCDDIEKKIRKLNPSAALFYSRTVAAGFRELGKRERIETDTVRGKKISALSNIANPESFRRLLESLGANIVLWTVMPDHHRYSRKEFDDIMSRSRDAGSAIVVMTAKDEKNLPEEYETGSMKALVLDIEARLASDEEKYRCLIQSNST